MQHEPNDPSLSQNASRSAHSNSILMRSRHILADLFMRMRPRLKWIARNEMQRLPTCKDDESDVVQQSMIKALNNADQLKGKDTGQFRAWIVQIVRNQAKDIQRYWQQDKRTQNREAQSSQAIHRVEDAMNVTPSKILEAEERQQIIDTALACLSIQDQQLIRWRVFQYTTYREIADRLKVTEPTARRRTKIAEVAFRSALERLGAHAISN